MQDDEGDLRVHEVGALQNCTTSGRPAAACGAARRRRRSLDYMFRRVTLHFSSLLCAGLATVTGVFEPEPAGWRASSMCETNEKLFGEYEWLLAS